MVPFIHPLVSRDLGLDEVVRQIEVKTPMGFCLKSNMKAYLPGQERHLQAELDAVEEIVKRWKADPEVFSRMLDMLPEFKDLGGTVERSLKNGVLDLVEFYEIKNHLRLVKEFNLLLSKAGLPDQLDTIDELYKTLDPDSTDRRGFYIENSFSRRLAIIRKQKTQAEKDLRNELEHTFSRIEQAYGIRANAYGEIIVDKDDKAKLSALRSSSQVVYQRENFTTVVFSPRPTPEQEKLERKLSRLKMKEEQEEFEVRRELSRKVAEFAPRLNANLQKLGVLDFRLAKACLARGMNAVKPVLTHINAIVIKAGRHPLVEKSLKEKGLPYTPVDITAGRGVTLITGANMGGKTVTLKMLGLLVAMAQMGLMVPADEIKFSLRSFVYFSGSFGESMTDGLSAFGAEIKSLSEVLQVADNKGLLLIDELARGTNPPEGMAIGSAVLEHLRGKDSITVVTTHFYELTSIPGITHLKVRGLKAADIPDDGRPEGEIDPSALNRYMDYRLETVRGDFPLPREALKVARVLGFNRDILHRAEIKLARGTNSGGGGKEWQYDRQTQP